MSQTAERHEISGSDAQSARSDVQSAEPGPALDACYGQIGISAVAAAARYQGTAKNPAYAPTPHDWRLKYAEELT